MHQTTIVEHQYSTHLMVLFVEQWKLLTLEMSSIPFKVRLISNYSYFQILLEGIPFAAPPVGKLRFMKPQPPDSWDEVLDLTTVKERSQMCPQIGYFSGEVEGNEDCLYVNVYTPLNGAGELPSTKLPVMVWIYGGGFIVGDALHDDYGPQKFIDTNKVVIVRIKKSVILENFHILFP